ncbi:MAG: APC family permease [Actinomycetota bacterium]
MSTSTGRRGGVGDVVKRLLVGRALATNKQEHQLLPKLLALPVFSSDPLSSVSYATEEMMLVLAAAGVGALAYKMPIAIAIAALLAIVVTSYRQTVKAYPKGGGSYIVAKENLGTIPGLTAAAAILSDYVLTVSVSVTAGTVAVSSAAPSLAEHRVVIALGFITLVTIANLRGVKEAGSLFAVPTYGFVAVIAVMLLTGFVRCLSECPVAETARIPLEPVSALTIFLILRAFASGATALTGVEAIADGVQAFRRPQAKNAARTLAIMGAISITMFLGITAMAGMLHVRVNEEIATHRSVLAQIGETVFGRGFLFFLLQGLTAGILILAANTSYQDFPRLSSILARDRFMPSNFRNRGDRLVFSNGVVVLAVLSGILIYVFDANLTRLIQLYVVGVFTAFTLSQAGMVRRWMRLRSEGWRRSAIINGIGAVTTGVVLVIVTLTKFTHGAWIVIAAMPVIVATFKGIHRHYESVAGQLRRGAVTPGAILRNHVVLLVTGGPATAEALGYIRSFRPADFHAIYIADGGRNAELEREWADLSSGGPELEVVPSKHGDLLEPVRDYVRRLPRDPDDFITVVIPELVRDSLLVYLLQRRKMVRLKSGLLREENVVVTDAPVVREGKGLAGVDGQALIPQRTVALVFISAVHDATIRAVNYALSLSAAETRVIHFSLDAEESARILEEWSELGFIVPLEIVEAPFRDLTGPMLDEVRNVTARKDTVAAVVIPEFIVPKWRHLLLHNQNALFVKRLFLFEPRVILSSVPYRIEG